MPTHLLSDDLLDRSPTVANCRMNRERNLAGSNGYDRELGFKPMEFLEMGLKRHGRVAWLDLCCGTGKALVEAARIVHAEGWDDRIEIVGVDLVGTFSRADPGPGGPVLVEASLNGWRPDRLFDLITCVHGLHYIGDKLGLIARASSWLTDDGMFVANLDLANIRLGGVKAAGRRLATDLRRAGLILKRHRRLVMRLGRAAPDLPYRYLGGDDQAGPNVTGQPAVDSYYEPT